MTRGETYARAGYEEVRDLETLGENTVNLGTKEGVAREGERLVGGRLGGKGSNGREGGGRGGGGTGGRMREWEYGREGRRKGGAGAEEGGDWEEGYRGKGTRTFLSFRSHL